MKVKTEHEAFDRWARDADSGIFKSEREMWQSAFAAGREAERKRLEQIIEDVKTDHWPRESGRGDGYDLDTCDEITRRIKEQEK